MKNSINANHDFLLEITLHDSYFPPLNFASEKETPTSAHEVRSALPAFSSLFFHCVNVEKKKNQKALMSLWVYLWHLKHLHWIL